MVGLLQRIGAGVRRAAAGYGGMALSGYAAVKSLWLERGRARGMIRRLTAIQTWFTAIEPWKTFVFTGVLFGLLLLVAADSLLGQIGQQDLVPELVATILVREVGPLVVAMILIARSGTAIATELGYMKVKREIEALEASGINVDHFIVLPRMLGVTLASVYLVALFAVAGLLGGLLIGKVFGLLGPSVRPGALLPAITVATVGYALLKATLFGAVIALLNCHHGLQVEGSFTRIPKANVRGVSQSLLLCFVINVGISVYALL